MTAMGDWCVLLSDAPKAKEKRKKSLFHAWGVQRLFSHALTAHTYNRYKRLKPKQKTHNFNPFPRKRNTSNAQSASISLPPPQLMLAAPKDNIYNKK